jgi:hypothetical protein
VNLALVMAYSTFENLHFVTYNTLFADDTSILITGKDTQDLIFNPDRINESILLWFDKNRLIINKDKSLALCFHHKSNKHTVFPGLILKDRQV